MIGITHDEKYRYTENEKFYNQKIFRWKIDRNQEQRMNRTDHNGALRIEDEGRQVELVGWVSKREISER